MSKNKNIPTLTTGFVSTKDYPLGQFGGCACREQSSQPALDILRSNISKRQGGGNNAGLYQSANQNGGAILPAIAAVYAGLKAVQPFSKAKKALEENVGENAKKSLWYRVPHRIVSVPASAGFGEKKRHRKRKAKK